MIKRKQHGVKELDRLPYVGPVQIEIQNLAQLIDHKAVGDILKDAKLDEFLEHVGVWKP